MIDYDEMALFRENAEEAGLAWEGPPRVERVDVAVAAGRTVSALVWGDGEPQLVLVHGGAQNAHTWDTVALALQRPLVAVDLPGHGHSGWRDDLDYHPRSMARDLAVAVEALAPRAAVVCGMSLGGLTSTCLAAQRPDLVRRLVLVDITPGVNQQKASAVVAFISGPQTFASFDEILSRTIEHNPTRSESSLRRGVLHNARQEPDGSWVWRYDRRRPPGESTLDGPSMWDEVDAVSAPVLLVRGSLSPVVDDDDVAELRRRQPSAEVVVVDGAGHSVQGDRPLELATILERLLTS